jgi:hypothetical protein
MLLAGCQAVAPLQTLVAPKPTIPSPTATPTIRSAAAEGVGDATAATPTRAAATLPHLAPIALRWNVPMRWPPT